jgi:hypothetical protein
LENFPLTIPGREGTKGSKSFNNRFDFERGLWWRKTGQAQLAEPPVGQVEMNILDEPPFRPNAIPRL